MPARVIDLLENGMPVELANQVGAVGPQYLTTSASSVQSTATIIGGPNGANILELNCSTSAAVTFSATTPIGEEYFLYNTGTAITIFLPTSTSPSFQTGSATTSLSLVSGKSAIIFRAGPVPYPTGSVVADRWIYTLTA